MSRYYDEEDADIYLDEQDFVDSAQMIYEEEEGIPRTLQYQGWAENFQINNDNYNTNPNCQYSTLNTYNWTSFLGNVPPVPPTTVTGFYVVPDYKSITYDSLVGAVPSCTGYRNIQTAYGANAADCNQQYVRKSCS